MRTWVVLLLALAASSAPASQADSPAHYDIVAHIVPATGILTADVTITLPPAETRNGTAFLIGRQYHLQPVDAGPHGHVRQETSDEPFKGLPKLVITFDEPPQRPVKLRFRYEGPLNPGGEDSDVLITPELIELAIDSMWLPVRSDFSLRFTGDADIRGIPESMVAVSEGVMKRNGDRLRIHRAIVDMDLPIVAVPGLQRVTEPDLEFYARDLNDPLVQAYRKHAVAAAPFHERTLGPLPGKPIRMIVVPRERRVAYARRGYVVVSEERKPGGPPPEVHELHVADFVGHEFAHAWWLAASPLSEDYWLAESMAEYSSLRYVESALGVDKRDAMLGEMRESAKTAGPILAGKRPSRAALYEKGPLLLYELEQRIGRPVMDGMLAKLASHPPDKTSDFLDALRVAAGAQAADEFEAALRAP